MQDTLVEQDVTNLDLSNVAALHQKRTLAFVNHFVITTVQFLNNFMKTCEQRLMSFERKLEKVDATMVLLEAKLSSIPEINGPSEETATKVDTSQKSDSENPEQTPAPEPAEAAKEPDPENEPAKIKPEYERFVKMVQVGVPLEGVKLKITLEGLDPQELDKILKK